jgi:type III pantothenate kinase
MQVVIDIGNTSTKIGFFNYQKLKQHFVIDGIIKQSGFKKLIANIAVEAVLIASVTPQSAAFEKYAAANFNTLNLSDIHNNLQKNTSVIKLPFKNKYKTPQTLGNDRIANAAAAAVIYAGKNNLVIDAGTCLKFDFIDDNGYYLGGAISPGLVMRYEALHHFTGKLPLLKTVPFKKLNGRSTAESIHAGVQNGMLNEVLATIESYSKKYNQLNIILTGGDWRLFAGRLKKGIFADPFFTLKGLQILLENNTKNTNA